MSALVPAAGSPLAALSDAALALALGVCVGQPQTARNAGRVSLLADELERRGVLEALLEVLDAEDAQKIRLLVAADRGQRWARTGRR